MNANQFEGACRGIGCELTYLSPAMHVAVCTMTVTHGVRDCRMLERLQRAYYLRIAKVLHCSERCEN